MTWWRVESDHYAAGIEVVDGKCVAAAPILRWAVGKTREELSAYFKSKGHAVVRCPALTPELVQKIREMNE